MSTLKAVQIGCSGHAYYAYKAMKTYGVEFAALSCGNFGIEAEGTAAALANLNRQGFTPRLYEDWREMLDNEKPDIAIVNPWFCDTAGITAAALKAGIHCFSEKPLAMDLDSLAGLEAAYAGAPAGTKLAGMFGIRYEAPFVTAKKAVEDGRIGEIRLMDSRKSYKCGVRPESYKSRRTYCGILPWVAIHAIDWMQWLSGEQYVSVHAAHSSHANLGNGDMDMTSCAMFGMTNEVIATVTADMLRPSSAATHGDDRCRLVGAEGILEITDGAVTLISDAAGGKVILPLLEARDIFADFLEQILHGTPSDLTAENAFASTRWALKARDYADRQAANGRIAAVGRLSGE